MHLKVVVFVLSFLSTSAYPHRRDSREAGWANPDANQANDKTDELTKDVRTAYKTQVHSSDLYTRLDVHHNPMVEEMRRKVTMESERLRARLHQELADLRAVLSPPGVPSSSGGSSSSPSVLGLRRGLRPLSRQLQSTMMADTRELCGQLGLYLQRLEGREETNRPAVYLEAVRWMSQTLEDSGAKLADAIGDFHAKASAVIDRFREASGEGEVAISPALLQDMESRWGQEVASLKLEVRSRAAAVKAELAALLVSQPSSGMAEVASTVERFCHSATLQNQVFQARIQRLPQGLEVSSGHGQQASLPPLSSWSSGTSGSGTLQEDFSAKLSALIQDILTSVHSEGDT